MRINQFQALAVALAALLGTLSPAGAGNREEEPEPIPRYDADGLLEVGSRAPSFALSDPEGNKVTLGQLLGRPLVLYFYPMDGTVGCTLEAASFRDDSGRFDSLGIGVVGISTDPPSSHRRFIQEHGLPFLLLSDEGGIVATLYGVQHERRRGEDHRWIARRVTYLLDRDGTIRHIYRKVDPAGHSAEILASIDELLGHGEDPSTDRTDPGPSSPDAGGGRGR